MSPRRKPAPLPGEGPRRHEIADLDATVSDLVQAAFEWWMADEDTDDDAFAQLRTRIYRTLGRREPDYAYPVCPTCGGRHPIRPLQDDAESEPAA